MITGETSIGGMKLKYTKVGKELVDPNPSLGDFHQISLALTTTYSEANLDIRSQAEKFLDEYCLKKNMLATLLAFALTTNADGFNDTQRKSAVVLLDKKLNYLGQIREYLDSELKVMIELLLKALFAPTLNRSLALFIRSMISAVTSNQSRASNGNFVWSHFVPLLWQGIAQDPQMIYGSMLALEAIVMGSELIELSEKSPNIFIGNLMELGSKIWAEFSQAANRTEPVIWETARAYGKLLHTCVRYTTNKLLQEWINIFLQSQQFSNMITNFMVSDNKMNQYGLTAIHFHNSEHVDLSETINSLRQFLLEIIDLIYSKVTLSSESNKKQLYNGPFHATIQQVVDGCCESLCSFADNRHNVHTVCEENHALGMIVMAELRLVTSLCKKNTKYYSTYATQHERVFVRVVMLMARISPKELNDMRDDPVEFANYTTDLIGFPNSGTCKAEAMRLMMALLDSVDGAITRYFSLLFGLFKECMIGEDGPHLTDLRKIPAFTTFKPEELVDIALLLLSSMAYSVPSREDLLEQIRGFIFPHLDKILTIDNVWLQSRLTVFLSQYFTAIFYRKEDLEYLKKTMVWMTRQLLSKNHLVSLC